MMILLVSRFFFLLCLILPQLQHSFFFFRFLSVFFGFLLLGFEFFHM